MRLHCYAHKPIAKFFGKDAYYIGIELECEAPDQTAMESGLKPRPQGIYAKHDRSLNQYGWEIITQPFAKNLWLEKKPKRGPVKRFFDLVKSLRDLQYQSHNGGRCGLHLHVCKKAFGPDGIKSTHFYWFARLVNGKLFRKLSQRSDTALNQWAAQIPVTPSSPYEAGYNRRRAVNVLPAKTVEVRMFRGNLREERIRKAVEAVVAAIEFARTRSSKDYKKDMDAEFVLWVNLRRKTYPNLNAYLDEIGVVLSVDDALIYPPRTRTAAEEPATCA